MSYFKNISLLQRQASCLPDCWCELPRINSFPVEPANSWSNIFFLIAAFFIYRNFGGEKLQSKIAIISLSFLGIGSFIFHSTLSYVGQVFDVVGMYVVVSFFILFHANYWETKSKAKHVFIWVFLNSLLGTAIYAYPDTRRWIFSVMVVALLLLSQKSFSKSENKRDFYLSLGFLLLGILCWTLDRYKVFCIPELWVNLHCFWHLFVSCSSYYYFKFIAQQRRV